MRATYACGELSATSSSTSISFTTAAPNSAWSSGTSRIPVASLAGPDHSIITETPAVSSRRRSTWACTRGHSPSSTKPPLAVVEEHGLVGHERDPAVGALRTCRRGIRPRTRGTRRSVRRPRRECTRGRSVRCGSVRPAYTRGELPVRRVPLPTTFLRRDARLPEERRRLRQGRRVPARRRPGRDVRPGGGRSRRREHVRVHRGRPPGVDRRRPRASPTRSAPAPSSWSPVAWPSATATSSRPRCPRPTR